MIHDFWHFEISHITLGKPSLKHFIKLCIFHVEIFLGFLGNQKRSNSSERDRLLQNFWLFYIHTHNLGVLHSRFIFLISDEKNAVYFFRFQNVRISSFILKRNFGIHWFIQINCQLGMCHAHFLNSTSFNWLILIKLLFINS